ncbi:MAG: tetratricopeptide repeat protein [Woeseia sp.]|nr:tetratricopeptide repeat protein [Woeseia sp.]MBT8097679.1 tetratricopeptide repeat protein [Woeseia sp.]NNE60011.1 tetratricopeptide repeat protein [Woeseia sp.]NNL55586.1 tetratricopeptide repeat protein [Woeseia sp.]
MNDLSEKEQIDELRGWWKENRAWVLSGIAIGLVAIIGFRMYKTQQLTSALQASVRFEELVDAVADNKLEQANSIAGTIFSENSETVYASQARLAMARLYMDRGRDADAVEVLRPLATASGNDPVQLVGRLRMARVLLYQGKPQEALDLLDEPADTAFAARFRELIGDAHAELGNVAEAATAYQSVLGDVAAQQTVNVQLVQMKLDDLPDLNAPTRPEATDDAASADAAVEESAAEETTE